MGNCCGQQGAVNSGGYCADCPEIENSQKKENRDFWVGNFGNEYTQRNRVDWRARIPFWREVIDITGARSVYEVGCNAGWNLSAIQRADGFVRRYGCDINYIASQQSICAGHGNVMHGTVRQWLVDEPTYDLVFTVGVLIHVSPNKLSKLMKSIVAASAQYVLAVEYADEHEVEVDYRGHAGKLWRRPFGKLYQDMGLRLVREWPAGEGFDNCQAWLLSKV